MRAKDRMSVVDVTAWVEWANRLIQGKRVSNIYHLAGHGIILFKLSGLEEYRYLIVQPAVRVSLTPYMYPVPKTPSVLAMSLRKYLRGERIESVEQLGFDREIVLRFSNEHRLYVELLPRGEAVLVDDKNVILHSTGYKEMRDRKILRGIPYQPPPLVARKPGIKECEEALSEKHVEKVRLSKILGLPLEVLEEALWRTGGRMEDICQGISRIMDEAMEGRGFIVLKDGEPVSFHPYHPGHVLQRDFSLKMFERFNDAVDEYFASRMSMERRVSRDSQRIREMIEKKIEEFREKMEGIKTEADRLLLVKDELEDIRKCVLKIVKNSGWEEVEKKCNAVLDKQPSKGKVAVKTSVGKYWISIRTPVIEQISSLYEEAKKYKKKMVSAEKKLYSLKIEEKEPGGPEAKSIRKREWYERFHWSFTRNGHLVIAGRNASQNEALVRKYMGEKDLFLHAEIHGAPATLLKVRGSVDPDTGDIKDAALIAAVYSRGWKEKLGALDVYWVYANQVSKTPPSGHYLWKGGFMVYGEKNYIRNIPLRLVIGIEELGNGSLRYIVGSQESVRSRGTPIAVIEPGDSRVSEIGKRIQRVALKRLGLPLPGLEELLSLLPGESRILEILL